jgi:carbon storage regulator CsrA
MLVLSRKIGERILIDPGIEIAIVDVRGRKVRIGVEAPFDIRIRRAASQTDSDLSVCNAEVQHRPKLCRQRSL